MIEGVGRTDQRAFSSNDLMRTYVFSRTAREKIGVDTYQPRVSLEGFINFSIPGRGLQSFKLTIKLIYPPHDSYM